MGARGVAEARRRFLREGQGAAHGGAMHSHFVSAFLLYAKLDYGSVGVLVVGFQQR